jgi:membrane protease subunit (stomatin/prohibitin family)
MAMAIVDVIFYEGSELVYKWNPSSNAQNYQIKLGSQLVVKESQEAVFFKEGKLLDVFSPGTHTLSTNNIPILSKLINLPFGSQSPFFAEVYFVNKNVLFDSKFGVFPFNVIDSEFKIPVSVSARGSFALKIIDVKKLLLNLTGTSVRTGKEELRDYFRGLLSQSVKNSIIDLSKKNNISPFGLEIICEEVSNNVRPIVNEVFNEYGLELTLFNIEGIPVDDSDPKVEALLSDYRRIMSEDVQERMRLKRRAENIEVFKIERSFDTSEKLAENLGNTESGSGVIGAVLGMGIAGSIANGLTDNLNQNMSGIDRSNQSVENQYYYSINGKDKIGPVALSILQQQYAAGLIADATLIWRNGLSGWIQLNLLPEANTFINTMPPDLPGQKE